MVKLLSTVYALIVASGCASSTPTASAGSPTVAVGAKMTNSSVIYVASLGGNAVPVFSTAGKLLRTITNGIKEPNSLALDSKNRLYVTNIGTATLTVYADEGKHLYKTISKDVPSPRRVVVNKQGTLFVTMNRYLLALPPRPEQPYRIQPPTNGFTALDSNDNLYVSYGMRVNVYAPGAKHPTRTISSNIGSAAALAFDAQNNLYVADNYQPGSGLCGSRIEEFAAGTDKLLNIITNGVCGPQALALDSNQNLYVANTSGSGTDGSVTVYQASTFQLLYRLTDDINTPNSISIDGANNLYVAGPGINKVPVYAQGATSPFLVLQSGVDEPTQVLVQR